MLGPLFAHGKTHNADQQGVHHQKQPQIQGRNQKLAKGMHRQFSPVRLAIAKRIQGVGYILFYLFTHSGKDAFCH